MLTCNILYALLMTVGLVIILPILFRDMLRFNIYITLILTAITHIIAELARMPFSPFYDSSLCPLITYLITVVATVMVIRFDRLIDMLIVYCFYQILYNIIETALMVISTAIYGILTGTDIVAWLNEPTSTVTNMIIQLVTIILSFAASLIICHKCMPIITGMHMKLKFYLFMGTTIPVFIYFIIRNIANINAAQQLSEGIVVCYVILLMLMAISLIIFFINVFLQTKEENQLVQVKIQTQNEHYNRVLEIQQELRETKHDLVNQLVAYNISQNTEKPSFSKAPASNKKH